MVYIVRIFTKDSYLTVRRFRSEQKARRYMADNLMMRADIRAVSVQVGAVVQVYRPGGELLFEMSVPVKVHSNRINRKEGSMHPEVYQQTQNNLLTAVRLIADLDLQMFIQDIEHAESVGPVIYPSLYGAAHKNLAGIKRLAEAAIPLWQIARQLKNEGSG